MYSKHKSNIKHCIKNKALQQEGIMLLYFKPLLSNRTTPTFTQ